MERISSKLGVSRLMSANPASGREGGRIQVAVTWLIVALGCSLGACSDRSSPTNDGRLGFLSLLASFPESHHEQAAHLDAWRVEVSLAGQGLVFEDHGPLVSAQPTVEVALEVELSSECEAVGVRVELSRLGQVWFLSNGSHEVCMGRVNEIRISELEWVRPLPGVAPTALSFSVQEGNVATGQFDLSYAGVDDVAWSASVQGNDPTWLTLQPTAGTISGGQSVTVDVVADAELLSPGEYSASISLFGEGYSGSIGMVSVTLAVTPGPVLYVSASSLSFNVTEGAEPDPRSFEVMNSGGGTLNWTAGSGTPWLQLDPRAGVLGSGERQEVMVYAFSGDLEVGLHSATIAVVGQDAENSPHSIAVSLNKIQASEIGTSVSSLAFTSNVGQAPSDQLFELSNNGGGVLSWTASDDADWLSVEPRSGVLGSGLAQWVTVRIDGADLDEGDYSATITLTDPAASNSPVTIPVTLRMNPLNPPTISDFQWEMVQLNDATCTNSGSRFLFMFDYVDPDGDVPISGSSLAGSPIGVAWWFRPTGEAGSVSLTGAVDGTGFFGSVTYEMCIAYQTEVNTSIDLTLRLKDAGGRQSNALSVSIPRPDGARSPPHRGNLPPLTVPPAAGGGVW